MADECRECERTVEKLNDKGIDWQQDKEYCDECFSRLSKEWDEEQEELNRYWRSTRF